MILIAMLIYDKIKATTRRGAIIRMLMIVPALHIPQTSATQPAAMYTQKRMFSHTAILYILRFKHFFCVVLSADFVADLARRGDVL